MTRTMAEVLIDHQRQNASSCLCGWSELGRSHPEHQAAELSAAGFGNVLEAKSQALDDMLTPEAQERARKLIEEELIDWRDSGLFKLRNNGLAVRNKDGSGSEIIRFGFEDGLRIAIKDRIKTLSPES